VRAQGGLFGGEGSGPVVGYAGLPLGNLTSQLFANLTLDGLAIPARLARRCGRCDGFLLVPLSARLGVGVSPRGWYSQILLVGWRRTAWVYVRMSWSRFWCGIIVRHSSCLACLPCGGRLGGVCCGRRAVRCAGEAS
jgi:hypothetical protein